jgi:macrolide transport system ATP-binding/permease protein
MRTVLQDLNYAARILRKSPGFTAVAALSLAIGIGANSAMFSFADALVLRPLPVPQASEVVTVNLTAKSARFSPLSWPEYCDFRDRSKTLRSLVAYQIVPFGLSASPDELPQITYGMLVSANFFSGLGVPPVLGRDFLPEEDSPAGEPAAILSHAFWKERFNADPNIIGRSLRLNGREFNVVGIATPKFTGTDLYLQPAIFTPAHTAPIVFSGSPATLMQDRSHRWMNVLGRLAPGTGAEAAQAEFSAIAEQLAKDHPKTNANHKVVVAPELKARFQRESLDGMLAITLVGVASLVLLIACANIANLMLARSMARGREIAIRLSIGAGRGRLIRQLLTESLLLSAIGGALGLGLAYALIRALAMLKLPTDMPIVLSVRMDERVLVFSITATLITGVLFGLVPAMRASRIDVAAALKATINAQPKRRSRFFSLRDALVVGQVAVALAVLSAAGMLIKSFLASQKMDVGFRTEGVLMMSFDPSLVRLDPNQGESFYRELTQRVRALPAVQDASVARHIPLGFSGGSTPVVIDGYEMPQDQEFLPIDSNTVDPHYFETLRTAIVRGRAFDQRDSATSQRAVIVNETMAQRYWPNRDALGARLRLRNRTGVEAVVIGIAKDAKYRSTFEPQRAHMYLPFSQDYQPRMTLFALARPGNDPAALAAAIRGEVRSVNASVPIFDVRSFRQFYIDRVLMPPRLISQIVSGLGAVGLTLAVIGLYGVIAYTVTRRTREIGVRMAIGAGRNQVARMVLREGLILSLTGVALGLPLAFGLSRLMSALMVDRAGTPLPVLVVVTLTLIAVTMLAAWIPARRASRIDPMVALRYE